MKPVRSILAYCSCQEIKDSKGNEYSRIPEWHNCDYIRKRNKLIPQAEEYAIAAAFIKEAYADLKEEGTLGKQEETILSVMKAEWNYSLQEISQLTGIAINAVSGRVNGLKKKGWLMECEKRPCSVTGKNITPVMKL